MAFRSYLIRVASSFPVGSRDRLAVLRLLTAQEDVEEEEGKKKGPPPRWQEFLDERYEGGKKRVPNSNPKTVQFHPTLATSTLLKSDKVFQQRLYKEYKKWLSGAGDAKPKKKPKPKTKPKSEDKSEKAVEVPERGLRTPPFKAGSKLLDKKRVQEIKKKYGKEFDKVLGGLKGRRKKYEQELRSKATVSPRDKQYYDVFKSMSPEEQLIQVGGHQIGDLFQKSLSKEMRETQDTYMEGWRDGSGTRIAHRMCGYLDSQGVSGGMSPKDNPRRAQDRKAGAEDKEMIDWVREEYAFTRAFFEHIGLKEVTVFRGIKGQGLDSDPPGEGDEIELNSREISSFTTDPSLAGDYGRVVEYKVPVDRIFSSYLTRPDIGGKYAEEDGHDAWRESEFVIMGTPDLTGQAWGRA